MKIIIVTAGSGVGRDGFSGYRTVEEMALCSRDVALLDIETKIDYGHRETQAVG